MVGIIACRSIMYLKLCQFSQDRKIISFWSPIWLPCFKKLILTTSPVVEKVTHIYMVVNEWRQPLQRPSLTRPPFLLWSMVYDSNSLVWSAQATTATEKKWFFRGGCFFFRGSFYLTLKNIVSLCLVLFHQTGKTPTPPHITQWLQSEWTSTPEIEDCRRML